MSATVWFRSILSTARLTTSETRRLGSTPGTIEGVQVLRAVAALMVVLHHARSSVANSDGWPTFGAAGVDIFFVISGFVMAYTTRDFGYGGLQPGAIRQAIDFVRKRFVRVVPLYWLALAWTARRDIAAGHVDPDLLKDFLFIPHSNAVYPDMLWPTVVQGWTLNYEMFFYAVFAGAILFGRARTKLLVVALLALVAIGTLSPIPAGFQIHSSDHWVNLRGFYTSDILLEFVYGILLQKALAIGLMPAWPRVVYAALVVLGFVLLALGYDQTPRGIVEGLPALLIVSAAIPAYAGIESKGWEGLANASYAIYLFHWASFGAVKPIAAWIGTGLITAWPIWLLTAVLMVLHVVVAVVAGLAIHRWVERPLLQKARTWFKGEFTPKVRNHKL